MAQHLMTGELGEKEAAKHLQVNGYCIIERNFKCKLGEIDIIAKDNNTIVFTEVKTRKNNSYGTPGQAVSIKKQKKIINTALYYLKTNNKFNENVRFDIVEVWLNQGVLKNINIIPNAFYIK